MWPARLIYVGLIPKHQHSTHKESHFIWKTTYLIHSQLGCARYQEHQASNNYKLDMCIYRIYFWFIIMHRHKGH